MGILLYSSDSDTPSEVVGYFIPDDFQDDAFSFTLEMAMGAGVDTSALSTLEIRHAPSGGKRYFGLISGSSPYTVSSSKESVELTPATTLTIPNEASAMSSLTLAEWKFVQLDGSVKTLSLKCVASSNPDTLSKEVKLGLGKFAASKITAHGK